MRRVDGRGLARRLTKRAEIAGRIKKSPCAVCKKNGVHNDAAIKHHASYEPGDAERIMWLCRSHHYSWHRLFVPEGAAAYKRRVRSMFMKIEKASGLSFGAIARRLGLTGNGAITRYQSMRRSRAFSCATYAGLQELAQSELGWPLADFWAQIEKEAKVARKRKPEGE